MSIMRFCIRVWRQLSAIAAALILGGCFTSEAPLINPQTADYPFQRITFIASDDDDDERIVIARQGDGYIEVGDEDDGRYLFVDLGNGLYLGQIVEKSDDDEWQVLYGIVQITDDQTMTILSPMCDSAPEDALAAAGIKKDDKQYSDECRITSLEQLKKFAGLVVDTDIKRDTYRIVELVR